ncbi:MAG TPA: hypothetical protein H9887_07230 [Candidatus Dorea intestinavium]|nr:hypothetical protein [Candidatus Dorea intestinavium]
MKAVRKDFFREIKNTPGRFLSIFFIVALGVAFFSGIRSAKNDMYYTADAYYDRANLADLKAVSNYGITKEEVESLKSLKGIEKAQGAYFGDYLTTNEDSQKVIRIHSLTKGMNELNIVEGRLPEKSGECVVDKSLGYQIWDEISLKAGKDGEIKNTLNTDKLKVVGIGESAFYIGFLRGNTNIGTGNINGFCAVTEDTFNMKVYTEVYLTLKDAKKETAYTKGYDELVKNQIKEVKSKTKLLGRERQEDLKEEALEEVGKARQNLDEKSEEARKKLELGKTALLEGKQTLAESQRALQEAKEALDKKQEEVDSGFIEYDAAAQKLEAGKAAYEEGKKTYQAKLLEYESGRKDEEELKAGIAKLEENISGLREQVAILAETNPESEEIKVLTSQLDNLEEQYQENSERASVVRKELEAGKTQLEAAKVTLSQTEEELKANEDKLATTKDTLVSGQTAIDEGRRQWTANAKELEKATEELVVNEQELLKGEKTLEEEMEEGEDKITQAKEKAQEIGTPKWEVEDRSTFPDYLGFKDNANRIGKVGKVFPAIFFLVAALVSLTTMTRLVEEQRTQIGTFKALGYTRFSIAMKYIGYGLIASLSGAVLGALVGEKNLSLYYYSCLWHDV